MNTPDVYAVVGHPVAHSRSPFIHTCFAEQTGENIRYGTLDVPPQEFERAVGHFRAQGGRGLNVTVPHKERAFVYATVLSERARRAGAVNTLRFDGAQAVWADNTDGVGLVRDLSANLGVTLAGCRVLLLGAGGAARGVLGPLLDTGPALLVVANRSVARADALAGRFAAAGDLRACGLDAIPPLAFDLLINATSTSLSGVGLPLTREHLADGALCYDMMYAAEPTVFLRQAIALDAARTADGRGMLVEQAAESFWRWRGKRPRTAPVIEALGAALIRG